MDISTWREALSRIQVEYIEMPDLKLTFRQVRRLCDLPQDVCERALASLVQNGFLLRTEEGAFLRAHARATVSTLVDALPLDL